MKDRQGKKIMDGDLVMVWQPSFERWVPGRVTSLNERLEIAEVHVGGQAHISPPGSDIIVIEDPGLAVGALKNRDWKRERPSFESLLPKEPCAGILCPICSRVIPTREEVFGHWEAGHFDMMKCECGFSWGIGSSGGHGHIVPPSLETLPLPSHESEKR
jgi:hypothetical protein